MTESSTLLRVPAATREVGEHLVVCAVGWSSDVHLLSGAARIVWDVAGTADRLPLIADAIGVDEDDEFLVQAVEMLSDVGLLTAAHEADSGTHPGGT